MENCDSKFYNIEQNLREAVEELNFSDGSNLEKPLTNIVVVIAETLQEIYNGSKLVNSVGNCDQESLETKSQAAQSFVENLNNTLQYIVQSQTIYLKNIGNVSITIAEIILSTFNYCKNIQKKFKSGFNGETQILDLFRKTQGVHTIYLNFLDSHLIIDFYNDQEVLLYKQILDIVVKISTSLAGVNMKSMADNWKCFIALIQKAQNITINVSFAIQTLTEQINYNLDLIFKMDFNDVKKLNQNIKLTGFFVKVILKLLDTDLNIDENFKAISKFCIMIYGWQAEFWIRDKHDVVSVLELFNLCTTSLSQTIFHNINFIKKFPEILTDDEAKQKFGSLICVNDLFKEIVNLENQDFQLLDDFIIRCLLQEVVKLIRNFYTEFFFDSKSEFYEDFIINFSCITLRFPNEYLKLEKTFLECIIGDNIWTSLIISDIWCLILKHSTGSLCRSLINILIKKIATLQFNSFHKPVSVINLEIFIQRIFGILTDNDKNEAITRYNSTNFSIWKVLNYRNLPLSHRYYVECLICDIDEKTDIIDKTDCSLTEMIDLMGNLEILSYTKFNDLDINTSRLIPLVERLWSFQMQDLSSNNFFYYFICKLIKITTSISREISTDFFILIFTQLKYSLNKLVDKLLICEMLIVISNRQINNFYEKHPLFTLITYLFQNLLNDKKAIVIQLALESLEKLLENNQYEIILNPLLQHNGNIKKNYLDFSQKNANLKYNKNYLKRIKNFIYQHRCIEGIQDQPISKRIKLDNDTDIIIEDLKNDVVKLINLRDNGLNAKQRLEVNQLISQLELLLK